MRNKSFAVCIIMLLFSCGSHKTVVKVKDKDGTFKSFEKKVDNAANEKVMEYKGRQWVTNASSLSQPTKGLQGRHISLWASHGRYFNNEKNEWQWQRPYLFCTTEDLFTQTIVVPFLMPMLEKAGANVFSPRERDWQTNEVIVDNDIRNNGVYKESNMEQKWIDGGVSGFSPDGTETLYGSANPFMWGTTRKAQTTKIPTCSISYQPQIPDDGTYAVYVSYPTIGKSISDAEYIVIHKGERTVFKVNQQMGGGTWVYLGTFDFTKGCSPNNMVILTNASEDKGFVTADAVRFGGGMGNVSRNGLTSGLPRCLEGARYYAQWAGAPDSIYNSKGGTDDYKDDINVRSRMTNWLAGGSCFMPKAEGKSVPIDLSLAVHSDAGYNPDMKSIYGSLSICTTNFNEGKLASGLSRGVSMDFARMLLDGLHSDMTAGYGKWTKRELYDRNYSETRVPEMPSAIIETLSHQSFPDMQMAQDPNVKFTIARSIYKTILKFLSKLYDKQYVVAPLPPISPYTKFAEEGVLEIGWQPQEDKTEPTSSPTQYIVYTAIGNNGFDNGEIVKENKLRIKLSPDVLYSFKVTAVNRGGESFPTENLVAVYHQSANKNILVINGFKRLSAPAVLESDSLQGFDMKEDLGVAYGTTIGWSGAQLDFGKIHAGKIGSGGLGYSGNELEGVFVTGNTFDYAAEHARAILPMGKYNITSSSTDAVQGGKVDLTEYFCIDYIAGLEKYSPQAVKRYKSFPLQIQTKLGEYVRQGGSLLVSGAYVNSDMQSGNDRKFLREVLHVDNGMQTETESIDGMGTNFNIYNEINPQHYAAVKVDVMPAVKPAFCTLTYSNGFSACVAYKGDVYRTIAMGFPFECIKSDNKKEIIMRGFMNFLDYKNQ